MTDNEKRHAAKMMLWFLIELITYRIKIGI
jgi:hypothetical protein